MEESVRNNLTNCRFTIIVVIKGESIMKDEKPTKAEIELAVYYEIYNYRRENE